MSEPRPVVIFVVGPTASGKTDFAIEAAERNGGEIINCDSVQAYQTVEIGTAKPTRDQLQRVPHHLVSVIPEGATYTAGDFRRDARAVIETRAAAGVRHFFLTGGSGFYMQAFDKGMHEVPPIPSEVQATLQEDARTRGLKALYDELRDRDPVYAAAIADNDRYRVLRALELIRAHGLTPTLVRERFAAEAESDSAFDRIWIGLQIDRAVLRERVTLRTRRMLEAGWVDEVRSLCQRGLGDWWPLGSVGYREVKDFLDGKLALEDLETRIVTSTMQLAKRQMTWFRREPAIRWFDAIAERGAAHAALDEVLREFDVKSGQISD